MRTRQPRGARACTRHGRAPDPVSAWCAARVRSPSRPARRARARSRVRRTRPGSRPCGRTAGELLEHPALRRLDGRSEEEGALVVGGPPEGRRGQHQQADAREQQCEPERIAGRHRLELVVVVAGRRARRVRAPQPRAAGTGLAGGTGPASSTGASTLAGSTGIVAGSKPRWNRGSNRGSTDRSSGIAQAAPPATMASQPVARLDEHRRRRSAAAPRSARPVGPRVRAEEDHRRAEPLEAEQGVGDPLVEDVPVEVDRRSGTGRARRRSAATRAGSG